MSCVDDATNEDEELLVPKKTSTTTSMVKQGLHRFWSRWFQTRQVSSTILGRQGMEHRNLNVAKLIRATRQGSARCGMWYRRKLRGWKIWSRTCVLLKEFVLREK